MGFFNSDKLEAGMTTVHDDLAPFYYSIADLYDMFTDERANTDDLISFTFNCDANYCEIYPEEAAMTLKTSPPGLHLYSNGDGIPYGNLMRYFAYLANEYGEDSLWEFLCHYGQKKDFIKGGHMIVDHDEQPAHYIISASSWCDTGHVGLQVPGPGVFGL